MIPLLQFKTLLADEAKNLSDKEIEEIRSTLYQFAELAFDMWATEKKLTLNHKVAPPK